MTCNCGAELIDYGVAYGMVCSRSFKVSSECGVSRISLNLARKKRARRRIYSGVIGESRLTALFQNEWTLDILREVRKAYKERGD